MTWKVIGNASPYWDFGNTSEQMFSFDVPNREQAQRAMMSIIGNRRDPGSAMALDGKGRPHSTCSGPWDEDTDLRVATPKTWFVDLVDLTYAAGGSAFPLNVELPQFMYQLEGHADRAWVETGQPFIVPAELEHNFNSILQFLPLAERTNRLTLLGFIIEERSYVRAGRDGWRLGDEPPTRWTKRLEVGPTHHRLYPRLKWTNFLRTDSRRFAPVRISQTQFNTLWDALTDRTFDKMTFDQATSFIESRGPLTKR